MMVGVGDEGADIMKKCGVFKQFTLTVTKGVEF